MELEQVRDLSYVVSKSGGGCEHGSTVGAIHRTHIHCTRALMAFDETLLRSALLLAHLHEDSCCEKKTHFYLLASCNITNGEVIRGW